MCKPHEYVGDQNIQEALEELCRALIRSGLLSVEIEGIDNRMYEELPI